MERVLVTGCLGFVGQILARQLQDGGFETWGVDRASPSGEFAGRCEPADLMSLADVTALLDRVRPRYIVHLAAQSSAGHSFAEPHVTIHNNVLPVLNLLEHLRASGNKTRLLAVGSADIYGRVGKRDLPVRESRSADPINPYALSKAMQEQCCVSYARLYGVDVVVTRSFNHTGPGQRDTFVLSSFARQIAEIKQGRRKPVVEVGNIDVRRDFSDVSDVCRAYIALLRKGKRGEVYNVCSGASYTLRELLEKLAAIAGVDVEIRVDEKRLRPVDVEELRGDPAKLNGDTGWTPTTPIEQTLEALVNHWSREIAPLGGGGKR